MRYKRSILNKNSGAGLSGYTVQLFAYSADSPYYTGDALYTLTDNGDGGYYAEVTTTFKATLVITTPDGLTTVVPSGFIGHKVEGDNQPTL